MIFGIVLHVDLNDVWASIVCDARKVAFPPRQQFNIVDEASIDFVQLVQEASDVIVRLTLPDHVRNRMLPEPDKATIVPIHEIGHCKVGHIVDLLHAWNLPSLVFV